MVCMSRRGNLVTLMSPDAMQMRQIDADFLPFLHSLDPLICRG
jgi:hypothetical protein